MLLMHLATGRGGLGGGGRGEGVGGEGVKLVMRSRYTRPATATTLVSKTHMAQSSISHTLPGIVREGGGEERGIF